ncbi:hypothetical protein PTKIN_Ptkin17bG0130400 [Pterospermum kingtungense]
MELHKFCVALVVMIMIIHLKPNCGRAAVLVKSNTMYQCKGLLNVLNECKIGQDLESELGFLMDTTNVIRILAGAKIEKLSTNALDANLAVQHGCPSGSYHACTTKPIGPKPPNCRDTFDCKGNGT